MNKIETGNTDFDILINNDSLFQDIFKEVFKVHPRANKIKLVVPNLNNSTGMGFNGPLRKYRKYLSKKLPYKFKIGNQYVYLYDRLGDREKKSSFHHERFIYDRAYLCQNGGTIDIYFRNKVI